MLVLCFQFSKLILTDAPQWNLSAEARFVLGRIWAMLVLSQLHIKLLYVVLADMHVCFQVTDMYYYMHK